eukprot:1487123-Lingulodinium_polyedra.AAC.1
MQGGGGGPALADGRPTGATHVPTGDGELRGPCAMEQEDPRAVQRRDAEPQLALPTGGARPLQLPI